MSHEEDKLKELFKKHMDIGPDRPQCKWRPSEGSVPPDEALSQKITDEDFDDYFYHQMEYFDWVWKENGVKYYGATSSEKPTLLGLFWGREDRLEKICVEFSEYLLSKRSVVINKIVAASHQLQSQDVPCEKLYLTPEWRALFSDKRLFGMEIKKGSVNKIEGPPQYGRFVLVKE